MREPGTQLRNALSDVDFGLQDSFCDNADLRASWEKQQCPRLLLIFYPPFLIFQNRSYFAARQMILQQSENEDDISTADASQSVDTPDVETPQLCGRDNKSILNWLFQILCYNLNNGVMRTPLHMMLGHENDFI